MSEKNKMRLEEDMISQVEWRKIVQNRNLRDQCLTFPDTKRRHIEPPSYPAWLITRIDREIKHLQIKGRLEKEEKRNDKEIRIEELRDILFSMEQRDWEKGLKNKHPGHIQPQPNKANILTGREKQKQFNHEKLNKKVNLKNAMIEQEKKTKITRKIEKFISKHKLTNSEQRNLLIFLHDLSDSLTSTELKNEFESIKQDYKNIEKSEKEKTAKYWANIEKLKMPYYYLGHFQLPKIPLRCLHCNKYVYNTFGKRCCGARMVPWKT